MTFTDGTHAVLIDNGNGDLQPAAFAASGMRFDTPIMRSAVTGATWRKSGFPGWSTDGSRLGFAAKFDLTSSGTSRGLSATGRFVVARVEFSDGSSAVLQIRIP